MGALFAGFRDAEPDAGAAPYTDYLTESAVADYENLAWGVIE
jgi:hypothetical protein